MRSAAGFQETTSKFVFHSITAKGELSIKRESFCCDSLIASSASLRSVTSSTREETPNTLPSEPANGVLYHSQVIARPSFVTFPFVERVPPVCPSRFAHTSSTAALYSAGMINPAAWRPLASSNEYPKIRSAAGFQDTTSKFVFHSITASGELSISSESFCCEVLISFSASLRSVLSTISASRVCSPSNRKD